MKKILTVLVTVILFVSITCFAKGEKCVKYEIKSTPDIGGWISVKEFVADFEMGDEIVITVYNGGTEYFSCFISAREKEEWKTVGLSETVEIAPGTSETIELVSYSEDSTFFLLELRDIVEGTDLYIKGDEGIDFSKCISPSSDLISNGFATTGVVVNMPEETEITPVPKTQEPDNETEPEVTPNNNTPTVTVAAAPTIPQEFSTPNIPKTVTETETNAASVNGWMIASIVLAAVVLAEAAVIAVAVKKSKKH